VLTHLYTFYNSDNVPLLEIFQSKTGEHCAHLLKKCVHIGNGRAVIYTEQFCRRKAIHEKCLILEVHCITRCNEPV